MNVTLPSDTVKRLRGQRIRIGYWMRLGAGTTIPGLQLRQNLKDKPGEGFYYSGGVADPAVWNHFETEGHLNPDLESMDIHTWCIIPEPDLARRSYFYMDDFSLQVIEAPPVVILTPLDEYYVGEIIPWTASAATTPREISVGLLADNRLVEEQKLRATNGPLRGAFDSRGLVPGVYTLEAKISAPPPQAPQTVRRQVILTPDPFDW